MRASDGYNFAVGGLIVGLVIAGFFISTQLSDLNQREQELHQNIEELEEERESAEENLEEITTKCKNAEENYIRYTSQYDYLRDKVKDWDWFLNWNEYPKKL